MTISVLQQLENSLLTTASISVTLTGVTAGSTIAVFATCESGRSVTGIGTGGAAGCADSVNGSYGSAPIQNIVDTTDGQRVACWRFQNSASGSPVVTVTFDASANFTGIWAAEVGGAATASADGSNAQWQATPTTTTDATTSGTITPSAQPGLIVGVCSNTNGTGATTAGTGFTDHGTGWAQAGPARFESKRYTSTSAIAATFTAASNVDHVTLAMAFKEAGGGGTTVGPGLKRQSGPGISPDKQAMFTPRKLSAVASQNVTVQLAGQTATFTEGTITPALSYALSGQTATFTEGTITASVPLVGLLRMPGPGISPDYTKLFQPRQLSTAITAASPDVTLSLSGQTATFTQGTLAPTVSYAVTGQTGTFTEGALTSAIAVPLTGQTATFTEGVISRAIDYSLTAQTATFTEGTISASAGGNVTLTLAGQTATFTEGALSAALSYPLIASSATFTEGTLAPALGIGLTGQTATFTEGAITASATGDVTIQLSGITATFSQGVITANGGDAVVTPEATGSSPGFVPGKKKRKTGPVMREGQVFGESFPISPDIGKAPVLADRETPDIQPIKRVGIVPQESDGLSEADLHAIHALFMNLY